MRHVEYALHIWRATIWVGILVMLIGMCMGCGTTTEVRTETVPVLTPVPVQPPSAPEIDRPVLPLASIDSTSTPDEVMRAYIASVVLLQGYARALEAQLQPYRLPLLRKTHLRGEASR